LPARWPVVELHDRFLFGMAGKADVDLEQEAVELRLGQG
jgi:hypothetical protein